MIEMKIYTDPQITTYTACNSSGFTLLEVLVAVFIFSIGLLGLAQLQVLGLRMTSDSMLRTVAAIQANDIIDRMRANVTATSLGVTSPYNNPSGAFTANPACLGLNSSGGTVSSAQCTPTQMAGQDFADWYANINGSAATGWRPAIIRQLPSATAIVCIDSTPSDGTAAAPGCDNTVAVAGRPVFAIKIWWTERKDANNPGVTHSYKTSFSL